MILVRVCLKKSFHFFLRKRSSFSDDCFLLIKQVVNAQKWNAKGLLLYVDPADYAANATISNSTHIIKWYPSDEAQSGGLWVNRGDPLTPGYPASGELASALTACARYLKTILYCSVQVNARTCKRIHTPL